jgi:hypothetical protein
MARACAVHGVWLEQLRSWIFPAETVAATRRRLTLAGLVVTGLIAWTKQRFVRAGSRIFCPKGVKESGTTRKTKGKAKTG